MREKLLELMNREGLKPSQLAEILEINPAGISHILAGRNKPSFELLQKILRRFPRINPDWLLLDSNQIYRSETSNPVSGIPSGKTPAENNGMDNTLFGNAANAGSKAGTPGIGSTGNTIVSEAAAGGQKIVSNIPTTGSHANVGVKRIVIFYEDQTFETYTPANQ